jgi:hypothetical protein
MIWDLMSAIANLGAYYDPILARGEPYSVTPSFSARGSISWDCTSADGADYFRLRPHAASKHNEQVPTLIVCYMALPKLDVSSHDSISML